MKDMWQKKKKNQSLIYRELDGENKVLINQG